MADKTTLMMGSNHVTLDFASQPQVKYYCGNAYLISHVVDLKHARSIDPNLRNNEKCIRVRIQCFGDILALENFSIRLFPPQMKLYSGLDTFAEFKMTFWNYGQAPIVYGKDGRPIVYIETYLSRSHKMNTTIDSMVQLKLDQRSIERLISDISPGEKVSL